MANCFLAKRNNKIKGVIKNCQKHSKGLNCN